jgi:digeranylgeranylglycerophospholipid reductase
MHDVIIIGAGPIGSYTAYQLAKDGFDVLVVEKNKCFTSLPACTGIIGLEGFKRFNLPDDSILSAVKDIKFISPSGLSLSFNPPSMMAFVVDRIKFDNRLRQLALKNGVNIWLDTPCEGIKIKDTYAEIKINDLRDTIKAKAICIASGYNCGLNEKLGFGRPSDYVQGVQIEVAIEKLKETEIYIGNTIAPGSFAWVVGINDRQARIGLTTKHNASMFLKRFLKSHFLRDRIKDEGTIISKIIPVGTLRKTFFDRTLVIGEAAGLLKTTTHGGIYYGLISSQLAVETIKGAFRRGDFGICSMSGYERLWRRTLDREIRLGTVVRRFFSHFHDEQIDRLFRIAMSDGIMGIVYKKAKFDWHGDLVFALMKHSLFKNIFRIGRNQLTF